MSGAAEGSYGIHLNYVPYLLLHTPVLGILKGLILIGLICWLFPAAQNRRRNWRRLNRWGGMKSVSPGCWRWCWGCG
jgi:hypothetical protein